MCLMAFGAVITFPAFPVLADNRPDLSKLSPGTRLCDIAGLTEGLFDVFFRIVKAADDL
jgi:hypothetical protein